MDKNTLWADDKSIYRVLSARGDDVLVIDCISRGRMPKWMPQNALSGFTQITEKEFHDREGIIIISDEELSKEQTRMERERYTMICPILPFVDDEKARNSMIRVVADKFHVCRRTVINYLCAYLAVNDMSALLDTEKKQAKELTKDQKNMRWALNKFYYNRHGSSIPDAFVMMLKEKYTDENGRLLDEHPSIHQFRYFFNKTRNRQKELISREGIKNYQLNHRVLSGDGVQEFAHSVGFGMIDATICDLYLTDDAGMVVGRPILVVCVDGYSGLCMGYALLWEGGVYSCRELLLNVIADKVEWCRRYGILITEEQWNCRQLPGVFITDRGSEFISYNFEQVAELGCKAISLPSFSANLKGPVEKFFDLVQNSYKPFLKGMGVIEPDFQMRGALDYRKEACLSIHDFERILIHCILYHNTQRLLENYPLTEEMLEQGVKPYPIEIWNYGREQPGCNLISVSKEELVLTMLPRTEGKFTRYGLVVNKMRYFCDGYTEEFLTGGRVEVAYNADDVSEVFLVRDDFRRFVLIERRYMGKALSEVQELKGRQKNVVKELTEDNLRAKVELAQHIEAIAANGTRNENNSISGIGKRRRKARTERHRDIMKEAGISENE